MFVLQSYLSHRQDIKLIDFGLVGKPEGGMSQTLQTCCGSPAYAAPGTTIQYILYAFNMHFDRIHMYLTCILYVCNMHLTCKCNFEENTYSQELIRHVPGFSYLLVNKLVDKNGNKIIFGHDVVTSLNCRRPCSFLDI